MKIASEQLKPQLAKGLSPVYVISGDETLLVEECLDTLRAAARAQGVDERESHVVHDRMKWDRLLGSLDNLSLFSNRKLVELRIPTGRPGRTGAERLAELAGHDSPDVVFVIVLPKVDGKMSRLKWVQTLANRACWIEVRPVPQARLVPWVRERAEAAGLRFDQEALELLAARTEGNLLFAQQEIDKLVLLQPEGTVTTEQLVRSISDGARFDVFQLSEAVIDQDCPRALRILASLRSDGTAAVLVCWALVREAELVYNLWTAMAQGEPAGDALRKFRVWNSRHAAFRSLLQAHDEASVHALLKFACHADLVVKGARRGTPWGVLLEFVLLLARPRSPALSGYAA